MSHLSRILQAGYLVVVGFLWAATSSVLAQDRHAKMTPPQQLIAKQAPPVVNKNVLGQMTPDNASVLVSLSRQRAYVYAGTQLAIDTPISSEKRPGSRRLEILRSWRKTQTIDRTFTATFWIPGVGLFGVG